MCWIAIRMGVWSAGKLPHMDSLTLLLQNVTIIEDLKERDKQTKSHKTSANTLPLFVDDLGFVPTPPNQSFEVLVEERSSDELEPLPPPPNNIKGKKKAYSPKRTGKSNKMMKALMSYELEERIEIMNEAFRVGQKRSISKNRDKKYKIKAQGGSRLVQIANSGLNCEHTPNSLLEGRVEPQGLFTSTVTFEPESIATLERLTQAASEAAKTISNISVTHGFSNDLVENIDDKYSHLTDFAVVVLVATILINFKPEGKFQRGALYSVVGVVLLSRVPMKEMYESFFKKWLVDGPDNIVPQSGLIADDISGMVCTFLNIYSMAKSGPIFDPAHLVKSMSQFGRLKQGVDSITKTLSLVIGFIYASIDYWFRGKPFFLGSGHAFVDEFLQESSDIMRLAQAKKLDHNQSSLDRVRANMTLGNSIFLKLSGHEMANLRVVVLNTLKEMKDIEKILTNSNFQFAGIRQEPSSLLMMGPPGAGKSQAMQHIAHAINSRTLAPEEWKQYCENANTATFNRVTECKYWDGYKMSHNVVFWDDILQLRDSIGDGDNEAMAIIRAVNVFEYQLHCADMAMKGNTTFRSNFVIANTNRRSFDLESIHDKGAFMRRWDLACVVLPRAEFCKDPNSELWKRKFSDESLPVWTEDLLVRDGIRSPHYDDLIGTTRMHPDMCEYHVQKLCNGEFVDDQIVDFETLIEMYHDVYRRKKRYFDGYLIDLDSTLYKYRDDISEETMKLDMELLYEADNKPQSGRVTDETLSDGMLVIHEMWNRTLFLHNRVLHARLASRIRFRVSQGRRLSKVIDLYFRLFHCLPEVSDAPISTPEEFWANFQPDWIELDQLANDDLFDLYAPIVGPLPVPQSGRRSSSDDEAEEKAKKGLLPDLTYRLDHQQELAFLFIKETDPIRYDAMDVLIKHLVVTSTTEIDVRMSASDAFELVLRATERDKVSDLQSFRRISESCFEEWRISLSSYVPKHTTVDKIKYAMAELKIKMRDAVVQPQWVERIKNIYGQCAGYLSFQASELPGDVMNPSRLSRASRTRLFGSVGLITLAGSVAMGFKLFKIFFSKSNSPQSDERFNRVVRAKHQHRIPRNRAEALSRVNQNVVGVAKMIINKSVFEVLLPYEGGENKGISVGFCIAVKGSVLLLPYHFVSQVYGRIENKEVEENDKITLRRPGCSDAYFILTCREFLDGFEDFEEGYVKDLAFVKMPKRFQPSKDITDHFVTEKQMSYYTKVQSVLHIPGRSETDDSEKWVVMAQSFRSVDINGDDIEPYRLSEVFKYPAHTTYGDCGSLLYVDDRRSSASIIGLHVAGCAELGHGYASKVTKEFILRGIKHTGDPYVEDDMPSLPLEPIISPVSSLTTEGKVEPHCKTPHNIGVSKIARSPLYGELGPVTKAPARLRPFRNEEGEMVDPMYLALRKYGKPDVYFDPDLLNNARDALYDYLVSSSKHRVEKKIFTFEEAVLGDNSPEFTSIARGKSAGFPYNCMPGKSSKERFFGSGVDFDLDNPECQLLKERVEDIASKARKGIRSKHYFTDCLKDECRPLAKVKSGSTRLFSGSPADLLIVTRMYFGSFCKWVIKNRIDNGIAIGINEYGSEWEMLSRKLNVFGEQNNKGAGDFSSFDCSHKPVVFQAALDIIQRWYGDHLLEEKSARDILFLEVTNSQHLCEGVLYNWVSSLPSGHPLTSIVNCLCNHLYFRMSWSMLMHPRSLACHDFNDHVYLCVLGDDNIFSVSYHYSDSFTEFNIQDPMSKMGLVYTPEDKDSQFGTSLRPLGEVSFLKRKFRVHSNTGKYVAPLDMESIFNRLNWVRKGANVYGDTDANVRECICELSLHDKPTFNEKTFIILSTVERVGGLEIPPFSKYSHVYDLVRRREVGMIEGISFDSGYILPLTKEPVKRGMECLIEGQAGLFRPTSRMACLQPKLYPGTRQTHECLIRHRVLKRIATNSQNNNHLTDALPIGLTTDAILETRRVEGESSNQNSDTTRSNIEGEAPITQVVKYVPLTKTVLDSARTGATQDVISFLAKPFRLATGFLSAVDSYPNTNWSANIPHDLLYTNSIWSQKVIGNFAFRGTLHLTVQVNANRFQQGRYLLCWVPTAGCYDATGANNTSYWRRMHMANLMQATQLPHVEIDLNCDSEATLIIPQATVQGWSALDFVNLTQFGSNGYVFLTAYFPVVAPTGSSSVNYTIFAHWEDVELAMPIHPQSGVRAKTRIKHRVKKVESEIEADSSGIGPIEGSLRKLSMAADIVGGIPLISSVAQPVSWALDAAARIASSFGWSKPHYSAPSQKMTRYIVPCYTNVDTSDNSTLLSYSDKNQIENLPGFATTDVDEMSLLYVATTSAFYQAVNWQTTALEGSTLISAPLAPNVFWQTSTQASTTLQHLTPLTFVSQFFGLYRGSIKVTFKIVKTEFHSGRLVLCYYPTEAGVTAYPQPTTATDAYLHREIIDIREGSEFSYVFPFQSISPYRNTNGTDAAYGFFKLMVQNPLVAPSSVSSSVTVIMEVSASDDFEWAQPKDITARPIAVFTAQSGRNVCEITSSNVGGAQVDTVSAARLCIGERVVSFRQLVNRFTPITPIGGGEWTSNKYCEYSPFAIPIGVITSTPTAIAAPWTNDIFGVIACMYAMVRGGVRWKALTLETTPTSCVLAGNFARNNNSVFPVSAISWGTTMTISNVPYGNNRATSIFRTEASGGAEVQHAMYNRFHSIPTASMLSSPNATAALLTAGATSNRQSGYFYWPTAPVNPILMRSGSEDTAFGLFVSVPPCTGYVENGEGGSN